MTVLNMTQLTQTANVSFNDFVAAYRTGNNISRIYYMQLANAASDAGQQNTVNYANRSREITENSGLRGVFENEYSKNIASDNGKDLTIGSNDWLRVQYDRMRTDLLERQTNIGQSGDGSLDYTAVNRVTAASYQTVAPPPATSLTYVPIAQLGEHDPAMAQAKLNSYYTPDGGGLVGGNGFINLLDDGLVLGFGASVSGAQGLSNILADWGDQAHWINSVLDAAENLLSSATDLGELQTKFDKYEVIADMAGNWLNTASWTVNLVDHLANAPVASWLTDVLSNWQMAISNQPPLPPSPLVLDIDGQGGVELTALKGTGAAPVYFDMDNDGFREATGWVTGGDGLLCIDTNGNGAIDGKAELFGDTPTAANGFVALDAYHAANDNGRKDLRLAA